MSKSKIKDLNISFADSDSLDSNDFAGLGFGFLFWKSVDSDSDLNEFFRNKDFWKWIKNFIQNNIIDESGIKYIDIDCVLK